MNIVPVQAVGALLIETGNGLLLAVENLHLEPAPRAGIPVDLQATARQAEGVRRESPAATGRIL